MALGVDRPRDDESALRLIHPDFFQDNRVTSAAFVTRPIGHAKYRSVSLFVKERLPTGDGDALHIDQFGSYGRARLSFEFLRNVSYEAQGVTCSCDFDAQMTPTECLPPLKAFADAHATLIGPTYSRSAAAALALQFNTLGAIEKRPSPG